MARKRTESRAPAQATKKRAGAIVIKIVAVVAVLVIALLLIFGGGELWRRTNGFATGVKRMHVEVNGTKYINGTTVKLPIAGAQRFNVGYIGSNQGFSYAVYANGEETFEYTVDGLGYQFGGEFTDCFNIEADDGGLTITTNHDTPLTVLQNRYDSSSVINVPTLNMEKVYYNLLITSADGEQTVTIGLRLVVPNLNLYPGGIIF